MISVAIFKSHKKKALQKKVPFSLDKFAKQISPQPVLDFAEPKHHHQG